MKASSAAKPFSGAGNQNLFKEMDNLSPFMQPDQMEEKPWWQNISLGQVVSRHHTIVLLKSACDQNILTSTLYFRVFF